MHPSSDTLLTTNRIDERTIQKASDSCAARFGHSSRLHLAFAIPGVLLKPEKHPRDINAESALETFKVNTIGPLLLLKHFGKFLPAQRSSSNPRDDVWDPGRVHDWDSTGDVYKGVNKELVIWACMSARVGSISDNHLGGWYSYRASKAAVNQLVKTYDNFLKVQAGDRAMAVGLHPGTVKTDLSRDFWNTTKPEKLFHPKWVAERLVGMLTIGVKGKRIDITGRGKCWDWDGKEIPP